MSSITSIKAALETRLAAMVGALPTAYENAPAQQYQTAFQVVNMLPAPTENPTLGSGMYRERGIFQVMLSYPINEGAGNALAKAEAIRDWFPRGASFTSGGVTTRISQTASIAAGFPDDGRYLVPVSVYYFADIFL